MQNYDFFFLILQPYDFKAINLYLGAGFVEISERKNYYGVNSHAKILRLELKASFPPRSITALPALRAIAAASEVTFGRAS